MRPEKVIKVGRGHKGGSLILQDQCPHKKIHQRAFIGPPATHLDLEHPAPTELQGINICLSCWLWHFVTAPTLT